MGYIIRQANLEDLNELVKLRLLQQKDDWGIEYEDIDGNFEERTIEALTDFLQNSRGVIFVLQIDGEIVGTCGLQEIQFIPQCNDNGKSGHIFNVYTKKELRHQGIQTRLMTEVLAYARPRGIHELTLFSDNPTAIRIYKKFGFAIKDWSFILEL